MTQETLKNRIDFVYIFDVQDGNPNGDPDAGNLPRVDAETGEGLVTDVCLKRKVRNYVQVAKESSEGYDILVKSKEFSGEEVFINQKIKNTYNALNIDLETKTDIDGKKRDKKGKAQGSEIDTARRFMCKSYFDVRTFGAVLSTGANAGQVRGPIQITFARSCDPIVSSEHSITICAARDEEKTFNEQVGIQGRKTTIPYGLYVAHGFISANLADQTGFTEADLALFWDALKNMFDIDRSAAHGLMSAQKLIVFKHDTVLGNAPANKLFDLVKIEKKCQGAPRSFADYEITIDGRVDGVEIIEMI